MLIREFEWEILIVQYYFWSIRQYKYEGTEEAKEEEEDGYVDEDPTT